MGKVFKRRIFKILLALDLAAIVACIAVYQSEHMKRCHDAPLPLGLQVEWYGNNLQFNKGPYQIIASTKGDIAFSNSRVKGAEAFKTITAYGISDYDQGVYFKAIDWNGDEQVFLLREYPDDDNSSYIHEVIEPSPPILVDEWAKVDALSCLVWIFPVIPILVGLSTVFLYGSLLLWWMIRGIKRLPRRPGTK